MDDTPYLMRGLQAVTTSSSLLISSSKYLNEPRLRDWISTQFLRRTGKETPSTTDTFRLGRILDDLQDRARIEELFTAERQRWPELDAWFNEWHISRYTKEDLLDHPAGSLGRIFGEYVRDNNFDLDIIKRFEPKSQYDYFRLRTGQCHDLEHLVCGGGFDILGELVPYYVRLTNIPRYLHPDLTQELNLIQLLGSTRLLMRAGLHYPETYPAALECIQRGMAVGQQSAPLFMAKYEDVLALPIPEARAKLGVVGAVDVDTSAMSSKWDEYLPDLAAAAE